MTFYTQATNGKANLLLLFLLLCLNSLKAITLTVTTTPATCPSNGQVNVCVNGGIPIYTYTITNGSNINISVPSNNPCFNLPGLSAGTYTLTVSAGNGSSVTQQVVIANNYTPLSFSPSTITGCCITVNAVGGNPPYQYAIRPQTIPPTPYPTPQNSNAFCGLLSGTYDIRIYDACNNFVTTSAIVGSTSLLLSNPTCAANGDSLYDISIPAPSNGTAPFTYTWTNGTTTLINGTGIFTGLSGCFYNITAVDGCTSVGSLLNVPSCVASPVLSVLSVNCTNGDLTLQATGGTAPYTFTVGGNSNGTGVFSGLTAGVNSYTATVTDACNNVHSVLATCINKDSISYTCNPQCDFESNITLCGTATLSGAYPLQYTCLTCSPIATLAQNTANICVTFNGVPSGTHIFEISDSFGTTFQDTVTCLVDTLAVTGSFQYACPTGTATYTATNQDIFYPITGNCLTCVGATPITINAFPATFTNVGTGINFFQFTDNCGYIVSDTLVSPIDSINVNLSYTGGCPGEVTFVLTDSLPQYPVIYTCITCMPVVSDTSNSATTVLQGVFAGNHTFSIIDACGNSKVEILNCVNPPLTATANWQAGCPGTLVFEVPANYPIFPLTYHCQNCGAPDIVSSDSIVNFGNVYAGIDTFTVSDSCGNVFTYFFSESLPSLNVTLSHLFECPSTLIVTPDSATAFYPFSISCNTCFGTNIPALSGNATVDSLCAGNYVFIVEDGCAQNDTFSYTITTPIFDYTKVYNAGCPGSMTFTPNDTTYCFPVTYNCTNCPANNLQIGGENTAITWSGLTNGIYYVSITDACGNVINDSVIAVLPPLTATLSTNNACPVEITLTPTSSAVAYPLTAICPTCPQDTLTVLSGNAIFSNVCTGTHTLFLSDVCGQSDTLTTTISPNVPADIAQWQEGCPGSITFTTTNPNVCLPITYHCQNCGALPDTTSSAYVVTIANVDTGLHIFSFTDFCGNVFFDTIACYNSSPIFSVSHSANCSHDLILTPDSLATLLPYTYSCLGCGVGSITSDSITSFSGFCPGTYTIVGANACGITDTLLHTIPVPNLSLQPIWIPNCPGNLSFVINGNSICYPLNVHCNGCGVNDTTISSAGFVLNGITPGIHTFTITDACNNVFVEVLADTLPPLTAVINCGSGCPSNVSVEITSALVSPPLQIICTDCTPVISITSVDTVTLIPGVGSGTHTYSITDNCGRNTIISAYCPPDTIQITATAVACDSMFISTNPSLSGPYPAGYFVATPVADTSVHFLSVADSVAYFAGLPQGEYVISLASQLGCYTLTDTQSVNYALFTLYQILGNGTLVALDSNYIGSFTNVPPGLTTIIPTFCDTTGGFSGNGSSGGGGGGTGGGGGGGGGNGGWEDPFFPNLVIATCREISVKTYPTDTVTFTIRDTSATPIAVYTTNVNDTIAYFNNLLPNHLYQIDLAYNGYTQSISVLTDSIDDIVLDPSVVISCDSVKIILPDTTSGYSYSLIDTTTNAVIMTNTNGIFSPISPGDYYIVATKANCDTTQTFVHIDTFAPILFSIGKCDSVFASVPNRTGITFTLFNAIDTFSNTTGIFTPIPAGTYTLQADHAYCGSRDTTLTIGNTLTLATSLATCDSLMITSAGGTGVSYQITRLDTTGTPYTTTNLTGLFGAVPSGTYAIVVSNGYCTPALDTVVMGILPTVIATKVACDSVVVSLNTPLNNVTYSIYNGNYTATSTTGLFGSVPLGTYTVKATHPQCNSDSTTVTMGGINPLLVTQPLCDSISAVIPSFSNIIYTLIDTVNHTVIGMNNTGNFGSLPPSVYQVKAQHPYCGADSAYITTGVSPTMNVVVLACDSIQASIPGYSIPFTYTLSGTANNNTVINISNTTGTFGSIYAGTFMVITSHPNCGQIGQSVTVGGIPVPIVAQPACDSITASVTGYSSNISYLLHDNANIRPDSTNTTGIFNHIYQGNYTLTATHPYCGSSSTTVNTGGLPTPTVATPRCDSIFATVPGISQYLKFVLVDLLGNRLDSNATGAFGQVMAGNYVILVEHVYCGNTSIAVNTNNLLPAIQSNIVACDSVTATVPGYSNITYHIQGTTNAISITNTTGLFGALTPNVYVITATHPYCGTVSTNVTLTNIPAMAVNQVSCDSLQVNVVGYTGITYTLHEINNLYADISNTTGNFYGIDSGQYQVVAFHPHCGSDTQFVSMGGIPVPSILQKTCDSMIISLAGYTSNILYTVSNGNYTASNSTGYFGGLPVGNYIVIATHPHCGSNQNSIILTDAPIVPNYCVSPLPKDSLGTCKFAWRLTFAQGQHVFSVFSNNQQMTPVLGQTVYDLFPGVYFIYDSLQCNGIYDTLLNPNIDIWATPAYCPNQGCLIASGGKTEAEWQNWAATTGLPICGSIGDDVYVLGNPPAGVNPVSTTGTFCGLAPGQSYTVYLYSQFSYAQGACRTDSFTVTLPTSINPVVSTPPSVLCTGSTTSDLTVNVTGMYPPCTFELLNPPVGYTGTTIYTDTMSLNAVFANLPAGAYSIRVSACGISAVSTGIVFDAPPLTPNYEYFCDSTLHLSTACLAGANYSWTNAAGTYNSNLCNPVLDSINGGTYFLTVSTPNCTLLSNAQLIVPPYNAGSSTLPTPTFTPILTGGIVPPLPLTLQGSNFNPSNYWWVDAFTQIAPITGTMSNIVIDTTTDQVLMTVDQINVSGVMYYYQVLFSSDYGTCLLSVDSFLLALPLASIEVAMQAKALEQEGKMRVQLEWETIGQVENGHFQISRTVANQSQLIGDNIPANQASKYYFVDKDLPILACGDSIIYAVKWIDANLNTVATDAKEVSIFPQNYQIYPNPASEWLQIEAACEATNSSILLHLYNAIGQEMALPEVRIENRLMQLSVKNLPEGVYFLRIINGEGNAIEQKFVKKN